MLARHENALIAALKARPGLQNTLRTVGAIPAVPTDKLLANYVHDAPAVYVAAPQLVAADGTVTLRFTLVIMVKNVADRDQARKGNASELGIDQYFTLVSRTINGKRLGDASWSIVRAEFADDDLFVKHGLTVLEIAIESTPMELPYEVDPDATDLQLDDFEHWHADVDIAPHALADDYGRWLATPPDYSTATPDAVVDIQLTGGSA